MLLIYSSPKMYVHTANMLICDVHANKQLIKSENWSQKCY